MEQQQILQRLQRMKQEFYRKKNKLEKAKRASKVRSYVKQKIQEHNSLIENRDACLLVRSGEQTMLGSCENIDERIQKDQEYNIITDTEKRNVCDTARKSPLLEKVKTVQEDQQHCFPTDSGKNLLNGWEECLLSVTAYTGYSKSIQTVKTEAHNVQTYGGAKFLWPLHHLDDNSLTSASEFTALGERTIPVKVTSCAGAIRGQMSTDASEQRLQDKVATSKTFKSLPLSGVLSSARTAHFNAIENVEDSLSVTPRFRSTADTDFNSVALLANDFPTHDPSINYLDSYQDSFSLGLHSDLVSKSQNPALAHSDFVVKSQNTAVGHSDFVVKSQNTAVGHSDKSQSTAVAHSDPVCHVSRQNCSTDFTSSVGKFLTHKAACINKEDKLCCASMIEKLPRHAGSLGERDICFKKEDTFKVYGRKERERVSLSPVTLVCHQAAGCSGGADVLYDPKKEGHSEGDAGSGEMRDQSQGREEDPFSEFSEGDIVPSSAVELSDDFQSEDAGCFLGQKCSRKSYGARNAMVLIKRRSPRLSSKGIKVLNLTRRKRCTSESSSVTPSITNDCDLCASSSCFPNQESESPTQFTGSKRKTTKTTLLLSSLFQFFIDDAKRDQSFQEFELPKDFIALAHGHELGKQKILQKGGPKLADGEVFEQFVDVIPETELDPILHSELYAKVFDNAHAGKNKDERQESNKGKSLLCAFPSRPRVKSEHKSNISMEEDENSLSRSNSYPAPSANWEHLKGKHWPMLHDQGSNAVSDVTRQCKEDSTVDFSEKRLGECSAQHCMYPAQSHLMDSMSSASRKGHMSADSPCLFASQSSTGDVTIELPQPSCRNSNVSKSLCCQLPQAASTEGQLSFTPLKKPFDKEDLLCHGLQWITFAGCAESGCREPVVALLTGIMSAVEGKKTSYILAVQSTSLTLWSQDDNTLWSAELHWYLPQEQKALSACKISDADHKLVAATWGPKWSMGWFLTVFIFHWNTQQTLRFNLRLPVAECPLRLLCQGFSRADQSALVVFSVDQTYSRGKKYVLDIEAGRTTAQADMRAVSCPLVEMQLVEGLSEAVAGLSADCRILLWNHFSGDIVVSLTLVNPLPIFSRMFTCFSYKSFLLLHMQAIDSQDLYFLGINPTTSKGRILKVFKSPNYQENLSSVLIHEDLVLAVTDHEVHVWDTSSATHLATIAVPHGHTTCSCIISSKNTLCLAVGHAAGCIHLFHMV